MSGYDADDGKWSYDSGQKSEDVVLLDETAPRWLTAASCKRERENDIHSQSGTTSLLGRWQLLDLRPVAFRGL